MTNLIDAFRFHRSLGRNATSALAQARIDIADGKRRYGTRRAIGYDPRIGAERAHGWKECRWIENVESQGLRLAGYSDDIISSLGHNGWYCDAFQEETMRGIVYRLPAKNGKARYVYGYADPCNEGCAFLSFDFEEGDKLESSWDDDQGLKDAARHADSMAEQFAAYAREYSEAWQQARQWDELADDMAKARSEAKALVSDMRDAIRAGQLASDAICKALRAKLRDYLNAWESARDEREKLADDFYYWQDGKSISIAQFAASNL